MFNECLHGKQMKNGLFFSLIVLLKSFCLRSSIKHLTQCFITRWNTLKFVKNTPLRVVFSTLFLVFHLVMKNSISCLIYYFKIWFISYYFNSQSLFQVCFIVYISSQMVCGIPVCHVLQVQPLLCEFPVWMYQFIKWHRNWG